VHRLIGFAESLLARVRSVAARRPEAGAMQAWMRRPLRTDVFTEGLHAIEWTVEDRGLAGLSDLEGIPWTMPMEAFFEAWVETVVRRVALSTGGLLTTGRRRETVAPLSWEPPYLGSQRSLVPDLVLEMEGTAVIFDAKYKRHWEEMQDGGWHGQSERLREEHRADLLQVLAYANLVRARQVVCCLVYPCSMGTWESLGRRGRCLHKAELPHRGRQVKVWLTAVPMAAGAEEVAGPIRGAVWRSFQAGVGG
jgi:hypothetical protein